MLASLTPAEGDQIKSTTLQSFAFYTSSAGWVGTLTELGPSTMYEIKLTTAQRLSYAAAPVPLPLDLTGVYRIRTGWNRLPCPYQMATPLASALPQLATGLNYADRDVIKSRTLTSFKWGAMVRTAKTRVSPPPFRLFAASVCAPGTIRDRASH